jgi:hypothetical protein
MYFIKWSYITWLHKQLLPVYATTHISHGTDCDHMITQLLRPFDKSICNNAEVECFISAGGWWERLCNPPYRGLISLKLQLCVFSCSRSDYSGSTNVIKWNPIQTNGKTMVRIFILLWYINTVATMGCMLNQVTTAILMTAKYYWIEIRTAQYSNGCDTAGRKFCDNIK